MRSSMKNILAVDFGKKRIGLAWLQPGIDVILPYGIIDGKDETEKLNKLVDLIKSEGITDVIMGWPLSEKGEESERTDRVRAFGDKIKAKAGVNIEYIDERHTSKAADQMDGEASRDEKAAMVILQSYVDEQGV